MNDKETSKNGEASMDIALAAEKGQADQDDKRMEDVTLCFEQDYSKADPRPEESRGLGFCGNAHSIGLIKGVNDESASLVDGFKPTFYELEILAEHYRHEANREFVGKVYAPDGNSETLSQVFAVRRLGTIAGILGHERFGAVVHSVDKKWIKKFADLDEELRRLEPCQECGCRRSMYDKIASPPGLCWRCSDGCP